SFDLCNCLIILALPAASNFRNCLSSVTMPKPLFSHFKAQSRVCASALSATLLEQFTSTTETSLNVLGAANAGVASRPAARRETSTFMAFLHFMLNFRYNRLQRPLAL